MFLNGFTVYSKDGHMDRMHFILMIMSEFSVRSI